MSKLSIRAVSKVFGAGTTAVDSVSLDVADGELVCLLGPSGSGKSTLLRLVGGFEQPTSGTIAIDGQDVTRLPPEQRPTGMVFQSHALWSHMNVFNNLAFGLKLRKRPAAEIRDRVEGVLELVGLKGYDRRMTNELSGGQQQRVALARSLILEPKILLLDEPFASLDQHLRERLREEVRDIQLRLKITTLFVTHGQDEALSMADRIVVMQNGRTEQADRPEIIYRDPQTPFVAGFIGTMNFVDGRVENGRFVHPDLSVDMPVSDGPVTLAVRPEALDLVSTQDGAAVVHRVTDFGTHGLVDLHLSDGTRLKSLVRSPEPFRSGHAVDLRPRAFAAFRDNVKLYRSSDAA